MNLPPIQRAPGKNEGFLGKYNSSCQVRVLHPLVPLVSPIAMKKVNQEINKAELVMRSVPPGDMDGLTTIKTSRLSPIRLEELKVKSKKRSLLKKKNEYTYEDQETVSELVSDFDRPAKDYFFEASFEKKRILHKFDGQSKVEFENKKAQEVAKDRISKSLRRVKKGVVAKSYDFDFKSRNCYATQTD